MSLNLKKTKRVTSKSKLNVKNIQDIQFGSRSFLSGVLFKSNPCAAGYDLFPQNDGILKSGESALIFASFKIDIKNKAPINSGKKKNNENNTTEFSNIFGLIANKSSMIIKNLKVDIGIVDVDYNGFVGVHLNNFSDSDFAYSKTKAIAQIIFLKYFNDSVSKKDIVWEQKEIRESKGFGFNQLENNPLSCEIDNVKNILNLSTMQENLDNLTKNLDKYFNNVSLLIDNFLRLDKKAEELKNSTDLRLKEIEYNISLIKKNFDADNNHEDNNNESNTSQFKNEMESLRQCFQDTKDYLLSEILNLKTKKGRKKKNDDDSKC